MIEWGEVTANKLGRLRVQAAGILCSLAYWRGCGKWKLETSIPLLCDEYDLAELEQIVAKIKELTEETKAGKYDHLLGENK